MYVAQHNQLIWVKMLIDCLYIVNVMRPLENHLFELLMLVLPLVWLWTVLLSTNDGHARTKRRDT